jgi:SAM-dependent methyltransferase
MGTKWEKYIVKTKERAPRQILQEAIPYVKHRDVALDLGAGSLVDSKYLLEEGFKKVVAIDADPKSEEYAHEIRSEDFSFIRSTFEDMEFPIDSYDLINAQLSLPYVPQKDFFSVVEKLKNSLRVKGILSATLFGVNNTLAQTQTLLTKTQVIDLLIGMETLYFTEEEYDKDSALGHPTHFHEFKVIARKIRGS